MIGVLMFLIFGIGFLIWRANQMKCEHCYYKLGIRDWGIGNSWDHMLSSTIYLAHRIQQPIQKLRILISFINRSKCSCSHFLQKLNEISAIKVLTFCTSFNQWNHSIKFRLLICWKRCRKSKFSSRWHTIKEYIERRHGEPFKFLFLPKMCLLGF